MVDETPPGGAGRAVKGWIKAGVGGVVGIMSGAALMYATTFVDSVIKPGKPVANFSVQVSGTLVTFQNHSANGREGWWDYGDGSALEPYSPDQPAITHTYTHPGQYTAKLSLKNLLGEENDRAAPVQIDGPAVSTKPQVAFLEAVPLQPDAYAPATFRVTAKMNNAEQGIWILGGDQPVGIEKTPPAAEEKLVTFKRPGNYILRLVVVQGEETDEKTVAIQVKSPPVGAIMAMVNVTNEAYWMNKKSTPINVRLGFPANHPGQTWDFNQEIAATPGWLISAAKLDAPATPDYVKGFKLALNPDHTKVVMTGQMIKPGATPLNRNPPLPIWVPRLVVAQELRGASHDLTPDTVAFPVVIGRSTLLPVPQVAAGWTMTKRKLTLDLSDGVRTVLQNAVLPVDGTLTLQGHLCRVIATVVGEQVRIDVTPISQQGAAPLGN